MDIQEELSRRGVDKDSEVQVFIDEVTCTATFLLYGLITERLLGYQTYNPRSSEKRYNDPKLGGRYYTYQPKVKSSGDFAVFGLDYPQEGGTVFVTEGVFEAVRLINLGYNSIAVLCSSPPLKLVEELHRHYEEVVWCGDNDDAGNKSNLVDGSYRLVFDKDLDEVDEAELVSGIETIMNEIRRDDE